MEIWQTLQQWDFLNIPVSRWFLAFLLLLLTMAVQRYLIKGFHHITHTITAHTETPLDVMLSMHILNPPLVGQLVCLEAD